MYRCQLWSSWLDDSWYFFSMRSMIQHDFGSGCSSAGEAGRSSRGGVGGLGGDGGARGEAFARPLREDLLVRRAEKQHDLLFCACCEPSLN
ncbi:hypothetical protein MTO96_050016 [Rhipicephalus appendiculatus]